MSVEDFTQVQLMRTAKATGGLSTARKTERGRRATVRPYLFRARIRSAVCTRKMEASPRAHAMYYRCPARTLAPGSPALADHPAAVYLRENPLRDVVNGWLGELFAPENLDQTVRNMVDSQDMEVRAEVDRAQLSKRLADAEAKMRRFQAAIEAGIDPTALVEAINQAQKERETARAELDHAPAPDAMTEGELYARIDALGDVGAALKDGKTESLANLYTAINLEVATSRRPTPRRSESG